MKGAEPRTNGASRSVGTVGMWIFLVSDGFSFAALLFAYAFLRLYAPFWRHGGEPPLQLPIGWALTGCLALSSVALVQAQRALRHGHRWAGISWLATTGGLGLVFLLMQAREYVALGRHGLALGKSPYASTFYVLTGFHGLHVLAGLIFLGAILVHLMRPTARPMGLGLLRVLGLYWQFVDAMWLVLFLTLYVL